MQVNCDWSMTGCKDDIEAELISFKFYGPGFYLTNTDTLLIIPITDNRQTLWHQVQPKGTLYRVYVYNCPFIDTLFSECTMVPVKKDERN